MLNVAWISASPVANTGYGRMSREIGYRLIDAGVPLTFIGSFGDVIIWGGITEQRTFKGNKTTILSLTDPQSAPDVIKSYSYQYKFDVIVGFIDCFGQEFLNNVDYPVIGYIPIDGTFTGKMKDYVRNYHKIIAYSKFGYERLRENFPPPKIGYIPHGIDTNIFKPLNPVEYDEAREWLACSDERIMFAPPVPKDCFLAVEMGANIGPRKELPLLMRTWSRFVHNHTDNPPHLLIFTNSYSPNRGYDLVSFRSMLNMEKYIHFPRYDPIIQPTSDENLRKIYGSADVFVHNACAEGFGLPLVESMSCGVPPIGPDNSAQSEVIEGNGWLVDSIDPEDYIEFPVYVPTLQEYPVPSQRSLLEKLEEAHSNHDMRKKLGRRSRAFVLKNYPWKKVIPQWLDLLKKTEEEMTLFKKLGESLTGLPT